MTAEADVITNIKKKGGLKAMLLPLVLGLAGAGGSYFAVTSGLLASYLDSSGEPEQDASYTGSDKSTVNNAADIDFVPIEPFVVSLPYGVNEKFLRFAASLEVHPSDAATVQHLMPRILDVLNDYLRAVTAEEFNEPAALMKLRGQMLRRIQIVVGKDKVRDLLVLEFVLN